MNLRLPIIRNILIALTAATAILSTSGCSEGSTSAQARVTSDAAWVLASAPEGAMSVTQAKAEMSVGDTVILRGIIGGSRAPISAQSPVFTVIDTGLFNQCTTGDDHCNTPWDYCCAAPSDLKANAATVQVIDASGTPITDSVTAHGFAPLDEIIVVGTVGPRPNAEVLTVRARGIYRIDG